MTVILAVTGASGSLAAARFLARSPWPVTLVASAWGRRVYERECGPFAALEERAAAVCADDDLAASISSGSVPTRGMVILPCTGTTLARVAAGLGDTLIARAAHCHLKERRPLVLCVREAPWSLLDCENAAAVSRAGGAIMPLSPPFYMGADRPPEQVTLPLLMDAFVDRVLALLGHPAGRTWETMRRDGPAAPTSSRPSTPPP